MIYLIMVGMYVIATIYYCVKLMHNAKSKFKRPSKRYMSLYLIVGTCIVGMGLTNLMI